MSTQTAQIYHFPTRPLVLEQPRNKRFIANYYGVSTKTVERWMKAGCPHHREPGRTVFRLSEVEAWRAEAC